MDHASVQAGAASPSVAAGIASSPSSVRSITDQMWPYFIGTFLSTFSLFYLFSNSSNLADRPLVIEPTVFDAGEVREGPLHGSFTVMNTSTIPYRVVSVSKSCDCTDVKIPLITLEPGEKVTGKFVWNLLDKKDVASSSLAVRFARDDGKASQSIMESELVPVAMRMRAKPQRVWWMDPNTLTLSSEQATFSARLIDNSEEDVHILNVSTDLPALSLLVSEDKKSVTAKFDPGKWLGNSTAQVLVSTDSKLKPTSSIQLMFR